MDDLLWAKIKVAREMTGLSQVNAAGESGWNQTSISLMEAGQATFIPNDYIRMLATRGINLNALFDPNVSATDFRVNGRELCEEHKVGCQSCADKDEKIKLLTDNLNDLRLALEGLRTAR